MFKYHEFAQSFIKIIVEKKTDTDKFERFISQLYAAGVYEIKVIEDPSFEQDLNEEIDIEKEDTLTILERYVDDMEHSDKDALKNNRMSVHLMMPITKLIVNASLRQKWNNYMTNDMKLM